MTALTANVKRRAALFFGAATLAASAGLMNATPAAAAASDCNGWAVCYWEHNDYNGGVYVFGSPGTLPQGTPTFGHDLASSIVNNTGSAYCFYEHSYMTGLQFRIGPWERWGSVPSWINDKISSFKPC
ncbi:peptidase inhibitor family I36 protein [Streptomyces sp. NPDC004610]|uniref:peptidase inhibitor family I36 protein n=1 Tax=unclassified Streptomyces TaxID=2593676 RepID=UPI0033B784DD